MVLLFRDYGKSVIDQRILKPRTRIEYEAKWSHLIEPKLGKLAVRDLTTTAVRAWFSDLDPTKATRIGHAYSIVSSAAASHSYQCRTTSATAGSGNQTKTTRQIPVFVVE